MLNIVNGIILFVAVFFIYQTFLVILGFIVPSKKFKKTEVRHNFAIIISARNEEMVIGQLLNSIKKQDYPSDKVTVFVCAHNCTDKTAEIARDSGAVVFEYNNLKERRKGYALRHSLSKIKEEYGDVYKFDGYFLFDADTIMAETYMTEMNKAFCNRRYDMYIGYLNSKNLDMGPVASYRSVQYFAANCSDVRPKSVIGTSTFMSGTGVLFRNHVLHDGFRWTGLAEDKEVVVSSVAQGYRSTYVEAAKFYTENPTNLKIIARQTARWTKGGLFCFLKYFPLNALGVLFPFDWSKGRRSVAKKTKRKEKFPMWILIQVQKRLSNYDHAVSQIPLWILSFFVGVIYPLIMVIYSLATGSSIAPHLMQVVWLYVLLYVNIFIRYSLTLLREYKQVRCDRWIFIWMFFWPIFDIIMDYIRFVNVFIPVKWKVIPRVDCRELEEINEINKLGDYFKIGKKPKDK